MAEGKDVKKPASRTSEPENRERGNVDVDSPRTAEAEATDRENRSRTLAAAKYQEHYPRWQGDHPSEPKSETSESEESEKK